MGWVTTNTCGTTNSTVTSLVLNNPVVITLQPLAQSACQGSTVNLTVAAAGSNLTYRWQRQRPGEGYLNITDGPVFSGALTDTLTISNFSTTEAIWYRCRVTNLCTTLPSDTVRLRMDAADIGMQGGVAGRDGIHDNNDFVVFIDAFFNQQSTADLGQQGGITGSDGLFDNNDFIAFIDLFFVDC